MPGAYGGRLDQLTVDEFDAVVLVEYPGLGHPMVLVDGKTPPRDLVRLCLHGKPSDVSSDPTKVYADHEKTP